MYCRQPTFLRLWVLVLVLLSLLSQNLQAADVDVIALKAAYISNFTKFVKTDEDGRRGNQAKKRICLLSKSPAIAEALAGISAASKANSRFDIRAFNSEQMPVPENLQTCSVVYFTEDFRWYIAKHMDLVLKNSVLLVAENDVGATYSMISVFMVGKKLKFSVNLRRLSQAQLSASSKLLRLAHRIYE